MSHIAIISASIRNGRKSHRVALHLERFINASNSTADLIDLKELDLPLFESRLRDMPDPPANVQGLAERIRKADGVIIVFPEYNGSFPASLKNAIDVLTDDWRNKPVTLCAVSSGAFGGAHGLVNVLYPLWRIKAWVVPSYMQIARVQDVFAEDGAVLQDAEGWERRTTVLLNDLGWAIEACRRMRG